MDKQMSALILAGTNDIIPFQKAAYPREYSCPVPLGKASSGELGTGLRCCPVWGEGAEPGLRSHEDVHTRLCPGALSTL